MVRSFVRVAVVALLLAALVAPPPARAGDDHAVSIAEFAFSPSELTVTAGDTVTWTNADTVAHTATSTGGAFDSGLLEQGESYSMTFTEAGTYDYLCTPHPSMTGRIVVVAAAVAPTPSAAPTLPDVAVERPGVRVPVIIGVMLVAGAITLASVRGPRRR